ncbi:MAG: VWA domain-containing protein [Clostridiales bacterium]|nr:VWA domain-containing protein [Clostridiales bacterium]
MSLLTPLGLLGLIGIIGLILIYILKPNYQQKIISSTFVWKLSLKYKKKKLPISRFRNILLLICQVLVLIFCALILTQPFIPGSSTSHQAEKIAVIDASASMRADDLGETRFERAINKVKALVADTLKSDGGAITIILADSEPTYVCQRMTYADIVEVNSLLDELADPDDLGCTYGTSDIEEAMNLASSVLLENPNTEVLLYTDTDYVDAGRVTVVDMTLDSEWNAAVLGCTASITDNNYYTFDVEIGCYGKAADLVLCMDIYGVNNENRTVSVQQDIRFDSDGEMHVLVGEEPVTLVENAVYVRPDVSVYSYDNVFVYFTNAEDSFDTDNVYRLYGGKKESLKVLYCSTNSNPFFSAVFNSLRQVFGDFWEIEYTELKLRENQTVDPEYCKDYDFYLFEYTMPSSMPTDGVVMLVSPDRAPSGSGLGINGSTSRPNEAPLTMGVKHDITNYLTFDNIKLNEYVNVSFSDGYDELAYCNDSPVLLLKDEPSTKVIAMLFSVKMSYAALFPELSAMMGNMFMHFFPPTIDRFVFDANDSVTLNARGNVLQVTTVNGDNLLYETFPSTLKVTTPGVYSLEQPILAADLASATRRQVEYFYVKVPTAESNIFATADTLEQPEWVVEPERIDTDIVLYFAIVLVSLLFAEWLLQIKEQY